MKRTAERSAQDLLGPEWKLGMCGPFRIRFNYYRKKRLPFFGGKFWYWRWVAYSINGPTGAIYTRDESVAKELERILGVEVTLL